MQLTEKCPPVPRMHDDHYDNDDDDDDDKDADDDDDDDDDDDSPALKPTSFPVSRTRVYVLKKERHKHPSATTISFHKHPFSANHFFHWYSSSTHTQNRTTRQRLLSVSSTHPLFIIPVVCSPLIDNAAPARAPACARMLQRLVTSS